ncbi:MAG: DUF1349 domain-containing protein, partial [Clostridiales bacterium]|nr:DUF1349 domain-containing protein [Clostridiales bacterium]
MDLNDFKWLNKSEMTADEDRITVCAPGMTDYFNSPVPENGRLQKPQGDAPFFYTEITGDFVARVKAKPNFLTTYDAASLMMIHDENLWIKAAFEKSDFGTTAVVSVVTNTVSDD